MASVDEINTVNPTWRIERKQEQDSRKDKQKETQKEPRNSRNNSQPDDGCPHIDEYA